jgi:DNA-binding transcriptional LysR family regulator
VNSNKTTPWFIRARLKTRQLMLLTAICDEGNIHRAAEVLNMSQPAASKLLKDLEDKLGVSLFERRPRGMQTNWYGETLVRHARIALSSLREAGQEVDALKAGLSGHVSLGAITGPALTMIPPALAAVAHSAPNLRVELHVESSDVLLEQLAAGKIDIMIGRLFERADKIDLHYERLAEEQVSAVVRPGHPLLAAGALTLATLAKRSWIVPPHGSVLRERFDRMFREAGLVPPSQLIETASLLFVTRMLEQTDFIAVEPTEVARYYATYGLVAILPIELSCTMDAFGIILRKDWLLSPSAMILLRALKSSALENYGCALDANNHP